MLNQWDNLQTTLTATQLRNATHHFRPLCIKSHSCANGSLVVFVGDPSLSLPSADGSKFQTKRNQYLLNAVSESLRCKKIQLHLTHLQWSVNSWLNCLICCLVFRIFWFLCSFCFATAALPVCNTTKRPDLLPLSRFTFPSLSGDKCVAYPQAVLEATIFCESFGARDANCSSLKVQIYLRWSGKASINKRHGAVRNPTRCARQDGILGRWCLLSPKFERPAFTTWTQLPPDWMAPPGGCICCKASKIQ